MLATIKNRNNMKRAFVYKDEKSHKFWWIDYSDCSFAVNYGKYGSIGKFEVKEFDTQEDCQKEAEKLIRSKMKKGYIEDGNFDFMKRLYIDSDEFGLNPKTSHPRFSEDFSDEIYYSEGDEETPLGSDEGHDTLICIFEAIRKNPNLDFSNFPQKLIEQDWDMEYVPITTLDADEVKKMAADKEMDMIQSDMVTYATAFAQIKITGSISSELKERGINAIKRLGLIYGMPWNENEIQRKMVEDLQSFSFIL